MSSGAVQAACPGTIVNGETVGAQTLTTGEDCTVAAGGTISTAVDGDEGIQGDDNNTITNSGTINTTGNSSEGIDVDNNATITNSGGISTAGISSDGIKIDDNGMVSNSGSISTTGISSEGIRAFQNNTISNSGSINTSGPDGDAIQVGDGTTVSNSGNIDTSGTGSRGVNASDDATVSNSGSINTTNETSDGVKVSNDSTATNSGDISTSGLRSNGIYAFNDNMVINSGNIATTGDGSAGIRVFRDNVIVNSGSIVTTGADSFGNFSDGIRTIEDNTIINSGLISATGIGTNAIRFLSGANELILRPGSGIIGAISLGSGTDTITFQNRVSTVLTFENDGNGVPEVMDANGLPFVISGTTVTVIDPTAFNQHDEMLADLTSGIFNSVHARMTTARSGSLNSRTSYNDQEPTLLETGRNIWVQGFAGWRDTDDSGPTNGADHSLTGVTVGLDGRLFPGLRLGTFAGYAHSEMDVNYNSQQVETDSFFGGLYAGFKSGHLFADLILTGGVSDYDSARNVYYNLAATGIQQASAGFDGRFISPELSVGTRLELGGMTIEPSARIRYAHLSMDGYAESGSIADLSIPDRDVSLWQGRFQVAFPQYKQWPNGRIYHIAPRIGFEGRTSNNDNFLANGFIPINLGGTDNDFTGFAGLTASSNLSPYSKLFVDAELHVGDGGFAHADAKAGVKFKF